MNVLDRLAELRDLRKGRRDAVMACRSMLGSLGSAEASLVLNDPTMFQSFFEMCNDEHATRFTGPFADFFKTLIQSFVENPEQWIKFITLVI